MELFLKIAKTVRSLRQHVNVRMAILASTVKRVSII